MKRFETGKLTIVFDDAEHPRSIDWIGEIDSPQPAEGLAPIFAEILSHVSNGHVEMRFDQLRCMNSPSVAPIMAFLRDLSATNAHVTVRYREDLAWQRSSFRAMRVVARKWPNVEVLGSTPRRP